MILRTCFAERMRKPIFLFGLKKLWLKRISCGEYWSGPDHYNLTIIYTWGSFWSLESTTACRLEVNQETHTTKKAGPSFERKRPKSTRNGGLITWRWEQLYLIQTNFQKRKLIKPVMIGKMCTFVQKQWQDCHWMSSGGLDPWLTGSPGSIYWAWIFCWMPQIPSSGRLCWI